MLNAFFQKVRVAATMDWQRINRLRWGRKRRIGEGERKVPSVIGPQLRERQPLFYYEAWESKGSRDRRTIREKWPGKDFWRSPGDRARELRRCLLRPMPRHQRDRCHQKDVVPGEADDGKVAGYPQGNPLPQATQSPQHYRV